MSASWCVLQVTAKVADFGLALPLDPADTHATLAARVSYVVGPMGLQPSGSHQAAALHAWLAQPDAVRWC
jgi:hypothetical protein